MEIAYQCVNTAALRPSDAKAQVIPPELDQLIVDCMAIDPGQRPASADVIIERLDAIALAERWDQQVARHWWAANAKRLGSAGHEVAVSAGRAMQQTVDAVPDGLSD